MAKACAYLCRQCCCIDGFGEFGEFSHTHRITALFLRIQEGNGHTSFCAFRSFFDATFISFWKSIT